VSADEALDEALLSIVCKHDERSLPVDVATLTLRCEACEQVREVGFRFEHSPYIGQAGKPLYRNLDEAFASCASLLEDREPSIDEQDWSASRRCPCRAPAHLTRATRVRLVRSMAGTGSSLVLEARSGSVGGRHALRVPSRGVPEAVEPTTDMLARAFGRPLTLFDAWTEVDPERSSQHEAEHGVRLFSALDPEALRADIVAFIGAAPFVVVRLDASTVKGPAWPASLATLGAHLASDGAASLVIDRRIMHARLRALAAHHGATVEHTRPERFDVSFGGLVTLVYPHQVARVMAAFGLTLADACAHALDDALSGLQRIATFLGNVGRARPEAQLRVDGGVGAIQRADGSFGPPFLLESLPVHLDPASPEMDREIRYLCDALPPWSDPTRVCTCGAAAWLERRLMPFRAVERMMAAPEREPWLLETWARDGRPRAVEVVVASCSTHRRIYPRRVLEAAGVADAASLEERLARDRGLASFSVQLEQVEDQAGARSIVARGPLAASILLEPAWLAGLHEHAGRPITSPHAEAWAFAPDAVCLLDAGFRQAERDRLAALTLVASGLPPDAPPPFAIRLRADLAQAGAAHFHRTVSPGVV
jgi:hypothetical protein